MRNLKSITTQDHMVEVVKSTEISDDIVCSDSMILSNTLTLFYVEGTVNHYTKENVSDNWELSGNTSAPTWAFAKPNILVGAATVSPTSTLILFIPKEDEYSKPNPGYLEGIDVKKVDRESFVELGAHNLMQKRDLDTYETEEMSLDDMVPDDVIIEE